MTLQNTQNNPTKMSGIDSPIKKLKPISLKDAHVAHTLVTQQREKDRLRQIEEVRKAEERQIRSVVSTLTSDFAKAFEEHKAKYLRLDTNNPAFKFVSTPRAFSLDPLLLKKAYAIFVAELKETLTPKSIEISDNAYISVEISVVDSDTTDQRKNPKRNKKSK
jgi:hypothetical protein